jgi:hypothetical protein
LQRGQVNLIGSRSTSARDGVPWIMRRLSHVEHS